MKVWFQNRRMKHKRQTLSKQGEDGDDKDSTASEGGKSGKLSDKFLDDEMSKKSCQGCEMPGGPAGCGPHEEPPDLGSSRGNNNNTPSATNNNTNFSNNSNGASSVASSGSFDKILAEEDSRSNEDSGVHTSPRTTSKKAISVKIEARKSSPNSERRIGMCKASPGSQKENGNNQGLLMALSDGIPSGSKGMTSRSLTPSSTPGTPMQHQSPIGPPGVTNPVMYPQLPRSSPTTATAIASATVTIQNVSNVPPFVARGAATTHFPSQYPTGTEYPRNSKHHGNVQYQMHQQQAYNSDVYTPEQQQMMNNHQNMMMPSRQNETVQRRSHTRQNYHHQQQYHNQHYYNYNKNQQNDSSYHNMNAQTGYNHGYGYNNHYGYHHMYTAAENPDNINMSNSVNHHETTPYYPNENMQHPIHKNQNNMEYTKNNEGYYENNMYGHISQTNSENYGTTESFQQTNVPNTAAIGASAVMTPPTSVQTDSGENYGNFHQFYNADTPQTQAPANSGENSNSSADFNFLSNLANDFAPEYYQLS